MLAVGVPCPAIGDPRLTWHQRHHAIRSPAGS